MHIMRVTNMGPVVNMAVASLHSNGGDTERFSRGNGQELQI